MTRREQIRNKRAHQERRQNLTIVAILVVAALAIAGILLWPSIRDAVTPPSPITQPAAIAYRPELVKGKNYGPQDAKVVVREYGDFQCPYCGRVAASVSPMIKEEFVSAGASVRFEFRHFVVADPDPSRGESRSAAEASECAADQGKFWQFHDYVYANQDGENRGGFRSARLRQFAEAIGLDLAEFDACVSSGRNAQRVRDDEAQARALSLHGTPTVFVNDVEISDPLDYAEIRQAIQSALAAP